MTTTPFQSASDELNALGLMLQQAPGQYRVNFRTGTAATEYVTCDLQAALEHGGHGRATGPAAKAAAWSYGNAGHDVPARFSRILKGMEVHFTAETEKKLNDLAAQSGRGANEVLQDALVGYFEEVEHTRETLNSRYDDLKSSRVKPIPVDEVEAYFREKSAAAHRSQPGS